MSDSWKIRKLWASFLILPIIFIGYMVWLQQKVDLNPAIEESLESIPAYDPNIQQAPFFSMIAFPALPNVDTNQLGKKMYDQVWQQYFEESDNDIRTSYYSKEIETQLLYRNDEKFSNSADHEKMNEIRQVFENSKNFSETSFLLDDDKDNIEALVHKTKFLIDRYLQEISHKDYQTLIQVPGSYYSSIDYENAHLLYLTYLYVNEDISGVQDLITIKLERLNQQLSMTDKEVIISQTFQCIDVLNTLAQRQSKKIQIPRLTTSQLSYKNQAAYELRYNYNKFSELNKKFLKEIQKSSGVAKIWRKIITPFYFNFNRSINQTYLIYQPYIKLSESPSIEFNAQINKIHKATPYFLSLRNIFGNFKNYFLVDTHLDSEILQPRLLDYKIHAFNIVNSGSDWHEKIPQKSTNGLIFIEDSNQLCIKNPLREKRSEWGKLESSCVGINIK